MAEIVHCSRCDRDAEPPGRVFLSPEMEELVKRNVCAECWDAWTEEQTRILNEKRLDASQPKSHEVIQEHMLAFLELRPPEAAPPSRTGPASSPATPPGFDAGGGEGEGGEG